MPQDYYEDDITYWGDGLVTYQLCGYGCKPVPSACEWMIPGTGEDVYGERYAD